MALVNAILTFSKIFQLIGSIVLVGILIAVSFLIPDKEGKLSKRSLDLKNIGIVAGIIWSFFSGLTIITSLANVLETSFSGVLDLTMLRSYTTQVVLGQSQLFEFLIAIFVTLGLIKLKRFTYSTLLLLISIIGIIAPVFQSHSASSASHELAVGALVVHVIALSMWVGGLIAIGLMEESDRTIAVPRFSQIALWSAGFVVLSGFTSAWVRLNFTAAIGTTYFNLVIIKILATSILIYFGYLHRKNLAKEKINWIAFLKLATIEVGIMIFALAIGAWLNSNQPPERPNFVAAPPLPPNLERLLFGLEPDAFFIGGSILAVLLYLRAIFVLRKRKDRWPIWRFISFLIAILMINYATSGGIGLYAYYRFSDHMIGHMIMGMIAPIGLVLSAPITLALRTIPRGRTEGEFGPRGLLLALLHSKYLRIISNPISALAIFDGSLFVLYFTPLFGNLMSNHVGHLFMNIHFILAGTLFYHVVIGIDPNPFRSPYIVRLAILLAAMSIHAFFSVALMSATTLIDGGYYLSQGNPFELDLLTNQQLGGAIGWAMSEIPVLLALVAVFIKWMRDDKNEAARIDRNSARSIAMGKNDELADYNQYLAELARRDKSNNE